MSILLETERLLLRPPRAADISHFIPLLSDFDVAKNLSRVPHPYTEDHACAFIVTIAHGWRTGTDVVFSILRKQPAAYVGICGVHPTRNWEFGYWLGKPFWGQGYATEAAGRLVAYAFDDLGAECMNACWFYDNPASGRVLEKLGFRGNGQERRACHARGAFVLGHLVTLDRATYMTRKKVS
jgi:RimJ/RimL family protein N-acetyltransferase